MKHKHIALRCFREIRNNYILNFLTNIYFTCILIILARIAGYNKLIRNSHNRYTSKIKSCATLLPRLLSGQTAMTSTPKANFAFRSWFGHNELKSIILHNLFSSEHQSGRWLLRQKIQTCFTWGAGWPGGIRNIVASFERTAVSQCREKRSQSHGWSPTTMKILIIKICSSNTTLRKFASSS